MKKDLANQLGFWAAIFLIVLGVSYLLVMFFYFFIVGFTFPPHPFVQLASGIITFLTVHGFVVLFTAIHFTNEGDNKILGSLGISFSVMFAVMVSINRFVQFTVIQQSLPDVPADLIRFLPYEPGSIMLALEVLGWGFFSSLAALCVAPLFSGSKRRKTIRWVFILYAFVSFMSVIGFVTESEIPIGPVAWGPILLVLSILLALYFRDRRIQEK